MKDISISHLAPDLISGVIIYRLFFLNLRSNKMSKVSNKAKRELFGQMLDKYKENNVMTWRNFQNAHFRVFTPTKTIDFYINSLRWHDIKNNLRGDLLNLQDFQTHLQ